MVPLNGRLGRGGVQLTKAGGENDGEGATGCSSKWIGN